jgi:RNA-directed DNA polymerase
MMYGPKESDSLIVPGKLANKAGRPVAESMEGSGGIEGNAELQSTVRTQSREAVTQAQNRIRRAVDRNKQEKLTALLHHVTVDVLRWSFFRLKKRAAPGVDGVTWEAYEADLENHLADLHARIHRGAYRAQPSRRRYIPKPGGQRPLGIAALEDKIVQMAVVVILTPVYEAEFLGFSYGFRPRRSQHDALDALAYGIKSCSIGWILDADIERFFDSLDQEWLMRFVEHRIADRRICRLIRKWLKAGVLEDGDVMVTEAGTPQGSVISPLLSNIYLHYVYDLWVHQWRRRHAKGDMIVIRYADDAVVGFQYADDAKRFLTDLHRRLEQFALKLHPLKTRLVEFGRFAAWNRARRGVGKPETFTFLGFTHICAQKRDGKGFQLWRKSERRRLKATLREVAEKLNHNPHTPIPEQGRWLGSVVRGFYAYHAVPTNLHALSAFRYHLTRYWLRALRRRSQRDRMSWERITRLADQYLPKPKILHPWPEQRFFVNHPR